MKKNIQQINFPQQEEEILSFWQQNETFQRSLQNRAGCTPYLFYDGPPFANGLPHYGHILANTIKDVVPRYWTMRGYYVERRFGWDCHGLPVEYEIEKREGYQGRTDILKVGIDKFNAMCRTSVMHYAQEWQRTITRLGRWVDWDNQYRTMDIQFMESVWWVCKRLLDKGLLYQGHKVVPYSPRITAVLSNFEANQNYKVVQDPALTVKIKANDEPHSYFLIWTTTPWTLVSNLALAVQQDLGYVCVRTTDAADSACYYLAMDALPRIFPDTKSYQIIRQLTGKDLVGRRYEPLFPFAPTTVNSQCLYAGEFVNATEGTGIVHLAPAFGEDDYKLCAQHNIAPFDPLDNEGKFSAETPDYQGLYYKDADKKIIRTLKERRQVLRHETIEHRYPFCERTDTPLIYRAVPAWYVEVEKIRDRLCQHNEKINWVPQHLQHGRMGNWLKNAQDWAISRNRFWGTPLPIWLCDACDGKAVVGSVAELRELTGSDVQDLHKHVVDKLKIACPQCAQPMARVPEVFDCWFESGAMPCAQNHYPFTQATQPAVADFIAEGLDQTRGWFYTLNVLSTALFDQPAFKNVVVNGTILDAQGKKMSKRHRNYTAPDDLINKYGSDAVRLYLLNSPLLRAEDLRFSNDGVVETMRTLLLPLWNAFSFLSTYADANGWQEKGTDYVVSNNELDRWIVSKLHTLLADVHKQMEAYRINLVLPCLVNFIDSLTNWYIRLNRRRFWGEDKDSACDTEAFATLYYVLLTFCKVLAPFAPFISERIYRALTADLSQAEDSVHLCDLPHVDERLSDPELETRLELVRTVIELGRKIRAKHQIKTRQVLAKTLVITTQNSIATYHDLIASELNVRAVEFSADEEAYVAMTIKPDLKKLGRKLGKGLRELQTQLQTINATPAAVKRYWHDLRQDKCQVHGIALCSDEFFINRTPKQKHAVMSSGDTTVLLDTDLTDDLLAEGLAREVVNRLQKTRKDCDLQVSDRISIALQTDSVIQAAVTKHASYIQHETLATDLKFVVSAPTKFLFAAEHTIDDTPLKIFIISRT
ncbi:MAG: isoleucine--tRNA ligase [Pseudomonadota bacterium]|nr:isoleucine--tRNA ligase [Pseudomonadota bacterium]